MTAVLHETPLKELSITGGLAGFPDSTRYVLIEVPEASPLFVLKSLDQDGLEFVVVPPSLYFSDYTPVIDDASAARLGIADAAQALVLVVLTIGTDASSSTANLLAPIVINEASRQAAQIVLDAEWPLRAPLNG
jgi:flagellar assembly factor FliW